MIAIPLTAPASTSLMLAPMKDETVCPGSLALVIWSSVITVSVGLIGANTGASFTWTVCVVVALAGLPASSIAVALN